MGIRDFGIVIDTNVIISSLVFGGKPEKLVDLILSERLRVYTSSQLISELLDILKKKFKFTDSKLKLIEGEILENFKKVYPTKRIFASRDVKDNKVLEVAVESGSEIIVTGDEDLLSLKKYGQVLIFRPSEFLDFLTKLQTK